MVYLRSALSLRLVAALAAIALTLAFTACGDSDDSGDGGASAAQDDAAVASADADEIDTSTPEGQVRAVLAQWLEGLQTPDPKLACSVVTPKVVKQIKFIRPKAKDCEEVIRFFAPKANPGNPTVLNVKVSGSSATMDVRSAKGDRDQTLEFTKSGGEWKISDGFGSAPRKVKGQG